MAKLKKTTKKRKTSKTRADTNGAALLNAAQDLIVSIQDLSNNISQVRVAQPSAGKSNARRISSQVELMFVELEQADLPTTTREFVQDLYRGYEVYGRLTPLQEEALERNYKRFC